MTEDALVRWSEALLAGDDRAALDLGLRLVAEGRAPLAVRLGLPGCWLRVRGGEDLDDFVDSLACAPGTPGIERALIMIAASRLHPAALATTDALAPRLLLVSSGLGALALGRLEEASSRLLCCAPRSRMPGPFAALFEASLARCQEPQLARFVHKAPPGPPSAELAARIADTLLARSDALLRRGDVNAALGLTLEASALVEDDARRCGLGLHRARLLLLLGAPAGARRALSSFTEHLAARAIEVRCALEEDQPAQAEALARTLPDGTERDLLLGMALAAQERWDEASSILRRSLDAQPGDSLSGACHHWLGILARAQGHPEESALHLRRALELRGASLGPRHPELVDSMVALGTTLLDLGQQEEATTLYERAHSSLLVSLGEEDPRAQVVASCLADLRLLGDALALERALAEAPLEDPSFRELLCSFAGYIVLINQQNRGLLTMTHSPLERGAVTFTTQDQAERFLAQLPEPLRRELIYNVMDGVSLGNFLERQGADGAVMNCTGAAPRAIPVALLSEPLPPTSSAPR